MKIKLISDLHLRTSNVEINNNQNCDVLIIGGDVISGQDLVISRSNKTQDQSYLGSCQRTNLFRNLLNQCSKNFSHVVVISGNHEFYHSDWNTAIKHLKQECEQYPNIYFLERESKKINDVTFIGATLWTDMNKECKETMNIVPLFINDYKFIKKGANKIVPADVIERHRATLDYISSVVDRYPMDKFVISTHHAPSFRSSMYGNDAFGNGAYMSDLNRFIIARPQIKLWTHGHTHSFFEYNVGKTKIVCNPRGYVEKHGEYTGWDSDFFAEV